MIAPDKSANIYPRSIENIRALLLHFFPNHPHSEIDDFALKLYDNRQEELYEIEKICMQVNKNFVVLKNEIRKEMLTVSCAYSYGKEALYIYPENRGSAPRLRIIEKLRKSIMNSEVTL